MDVEWIYYFVGMCFGLTLGIVVTSIFTYGRAFFIRFIRKKTPIEPVIIGTGKIDVPVYAIDMNRFTHKGLPYVAPEGSTIPKSLITGSVSAIYFEGIPSPLTLTPNSVNFKLKDNTILSAAIRAVLQTDALTKMFSREKITKFMILIAQVATIIMLVLLTTQVNSLSNLIHNIPDPIIQSVNEAKQAITDLAKTIATPPPGTSGLGETIKPPPGA